MHAKVPNRKKRDLFARDAMLAQEFSNRSKSYFHRYQIKGKRKSVFVSRERKRFEMKFSANPFFWFFGAFVTYLAAFAFESDFLFLPLKASQYKITTQTLKEELNILHMWCRDACRFPCLIFQRVTEKSYLAWSQIFKGNCQKNRFSLKLWRFVGCLTCNQGCMIFRKKLYCNI